MNDGTITLPWLVIRQDDNGNRYRVGRYATRAEAFAAISRSARWKIAEGPQIDETSHQYVEFSFNLDTSQLPRPMQIGIGGEKDWAMSVQRTQKIN